MVPNQPTIDPSEDNPALADVMERNINTIIALRAKDDRNRPWYDRAADAITNFAGRIVFLVIHVILFSAWIVINTGQVGIPAFDPYPYNMLVTVVSLEAICLSIFVLITQRRSSMESERRADLALQIGLLTEYELTRVIKMLDAIQDRMDIENDEDKELIDLEMETHPEDVLAEIDRVRQRAYKELGI